MSSQESTPRDLPKSPSPAPLKREKSLPVIRGDDNDKEMSPDILTDDEMKSDDDKEEDSSFHFPLSYGVRKRSSSCSDAKSNLLQRAESVPVINTEYKGTDYWISFVVYFEIFDQFSFYCFYIFRTIQ